MAHMGFWEFYDAHENEIKLMQTIMNHQDEIPMTAIRDIFNQMIQPLDEYVSFHCEDWNAHNLAYDLYERGALC